MIGSWRAEPRPALPPSPAGRRRAWTAEPPRCRSPRMPETESELVVFSGNSNKPLVKEICEYLEIPVGRCEVGKFSDGEIQIEIAENVRGRDVFLVRSEARRV